MYGYGRQIAIGVVVFVAVLGIAGLVKALVADSTTAALIFAGLLIAPILAGFLLPIQPFIVLRSAFRRFGRGADAELASSTVSPRFAHFEPARATCGFCSYRRSWP